MHYGNITRGLVVVAVAAMTAGAAGACSSSKPKAAAATAPKAFTYWSGWHESDPQAAVLKSAIDAYTAQTGVKITVEWHGPNVMADAAAAAKDGGAVPDLVDGDLAAAMSDLVSQDKAADLSALYSRPIPGETLQLGDAVPAKFQTLLRDKQNALVMVPYQMSTEVVFFDKSRHPELAGDSKPQTWDDFTAALARVKKAGQAPLALDPSPANAAYWTEWVLERELDHGGFPKTAEERQAPQTPGEPSLWADPRLLDGAKKIEQLVKAGYFAPGYAAEDTGEGSAHAADQQAKWAAGGAAMILGDTSVPDRTSPTLGTDLPNVDSFVFPAISDADGNRGDNSASVDFVGFTVPQDAVNKDAAEQFVLYFMGKPRISKISSQADALTPRIDVPAPPPLEGVQAALTNRTVFADLDALPQNDGAWYAQVFQPLSTDLVKGKLTGQQFVAKLRDQSYAFWANQG
jgi:raffinose/stachyose/melibiose transport system substrate-binding protein